MDFSNIDLKDHQHLARTIVQRAATAKLNDRSAFEKFRNKIIKEHSGTTFHNLYFIKAYQDLIKEGIIKPNQKLLSLIQKRRIRTMSGVAPVTVLTKPFPCPGKCVYCPTDVRMPKSYLPRQPAAQRAFRQQFNPYSQVFVRLKALSMIGHEVSKVELRVIGGTWSSYPKQYQTWFLKRCLQAMNDFHEIMKNPDLEKTEKFTQKHTVKSPYGRDEINTFHIMGISSAKEPWSTTVQKNSSAKIRCIGINIETRPDYIDKKEIKRLRRLGITKVEIGVQTTDDTVQKLTKRGHNLATVRKATTLLKDSGFKIGYHMMPNLPGATPGLDKKMIKKLFETEEYQPDYLKIYPCVVVPKAALANWYKDGRYKPYNDETLFDVLLEEIASVPEWCRIDRVARDIPATDILAGTKFSNIRQILEKKLIEQGRPCRDIRSREIMDGETDHKHIKLITREYQASGGREIFLSYEDTQKDRLIALLRLRFPKKTFLQALKNAAIIREIHVYGKQIPVGEKIKGAKQHIGWGTKLMREAEKRAGQAGYAKVAVIAGIGTREYYRKKLGYKLEETYMCKSI